MVPGLRRAGVFCGALLALVLLIGLAGLPVYVRPQTDPLRKADAIVVLGGTAYERFDLGLDLAQRGYAPTLLISRSTGLDDHEMDRYCAGRFDFTVSCFVPDPWTTVGEAHEIRRRAQQFGWRHLIVVTHTPHVSRARYIVAKCFDGDLTMVASPSASGLRFWTWMYLRQSAGYLRTFLSPDC
ncbi:YdcF family protein [Nocardia sp. XZ_19_369]|uniref:YdcF family protein n=1 Tax=Nocardia sp. XZ_19_369 TaxID=2769487 RepID=UPI0018902F9B|nr:YdcF family protein [Nocardia sp. XZ_19_369]